MGKITKFRAEESCNKITPANRTRKQEYENEHHSGHGNRRQRGDGKKVVP